MGRGMRRLLAVTMLFASACGPQIVSTASDGPGLTASPASSEGASQQPTESVLPSPTTAPTQAPTAQPTAAPTSPPAAEVLLPGSAIVVNVAELNLRAKPSATAKRIEVLKKNQVLIVSPMDNLWIGAGPVISGGYAWYPVLKAHVTGGPGALPALPKGPILYGADVTTGWIAAFKGAAPYVKTLAPRCPDTMNLANVEGMLPAERLACFGGQIELDGVFGCNACGGEGSATFEPPWLASPLFLDFLSTDPSATIGPIAFAFPPTGPPRPPAGSILHVVLHVDDAAATGCTIKIPDDGGTLRSVPKATAILYCRERLVVDSYTVTGTYPGFDSL